MVRAPNSGVSRCVNSFPDAVVVDAIDCLYVSLIPYYVSIFLQGLMARLRFLTGGRLTASSLWQYSGSWPSVVNLVSSFSRKQVEYPSIDQMQFTVVAEVNLPGPGACFVTGYRSESVPKSSLALFFGVSLNVAEQESCVKCRIQS